MPTPSGQLTAPRLRTLLDEGTLAGDWELDAAKSSIRLKNKAIWGLATVNGVFQEISGSGVIAPDGTASGTLTVAAASIDTRNPRRDKHLRSADFLDAGNHPAITFALDTVQPSDQGATITGSLTIRGHSQPLSLQAAAAVLDDGEIRLDTEAVVNRSDYGITWNQLGTIAMNCTLTVHAVFTRR